MDDTGAAANLPRLNPFAFSADTDFRFVLLIVSVLGASLFINYALYWSVQSRSEKALQAGRDYQHCVDEANAVYSANQFTSAYINALSKCGKALPATERREGRWMIFGLLLLLAVTLTIYWTFPARKIRREQLVPLTDREAPEIRIYLGELWREAGLSRRPVFLWSPLHPAPSAVAFGHLARSYVALTGGLVARFYSDKPAFRAVVLHELAHLRNADVSKTYFAVAVWQAFVFVALVPFVLTLLLQILKGPGFVANLSFRVLALGALVYLMRNAVLRARELYADVRASVWDGEGGALRRVLEALPQQKAARWRKVLQIHPDPVERRLSVDATDRLFRMSFWDAFTAGVATTIAASNIELLLYYLTSNTGVVLRAPALILVPLAVGVVGSGAWRAAFAALAQGQPLRGTGRLGFALGLGCIAGQMLSLEGYIETSVYGSSLAIFGFWMILTALLLASSFSLVEWIASGASTWLEVAMAGHSPRPAQIIGLIIAGVLFALWVGNLFSLYVIGAGVSGGRGFLNLVYFLGNHLFVVLTVEPLTLVALMSLWAFPLSAWIWKRQPTTGALARWVFLDPARQMPVPRVAPLNPGLALRIGAVGGLLFWVVLLAFWAGWRLGVNEVTRRVPRVVIAFAILQVASAALAQAVLAVAVASRVARLGAVHGLFAAFLAGCVTAAGMLALIFVFGRGMNLGFAWKVFSQVVNAGALLALLALGASRLVGWIVRPKPLVAVTESTAN